MYFVIIVFYLKVEFIKNGNKQKLMIINELFEGPVGDYCIARNTIKCLFQMQLSHILLPDMTLVQNHTLVRVFAVVYSVVE